jgi:hypothetical protein
LEGKRELLYSSLADLDLDHSAGKVNDEDYQAVRAGSPG